MTQHDPGNIGQKLLVSQIIYAALLAGGLMFAGICLLVSIAMTEQAVDDPTAAAMDVSILRYVWFGAFAVAVIGALAMGRLTSSSLPQDGTADAKAMFNPFLVATIARGALLEGASLYGSILLLLGDNLGDLLFALIPLGVMVPFFPTSRRFIRFAHGGEGPDREGGLAAPSRDFRDYR